MWIECQSGTELKKHTKNLYILKLKDFFQYLTHMNNTKLCTFPRHSKSNPIELNFNFNSIGGLSSIEFGNRTESNSPKRKKNQSNPIERLIFELVIYVKQTLKIHYQILEARVTSALSVAHVFFVSEEIPQKCLQMRCGS